MIASNPKLVALEVVRHRCIIRAGSGSLALPGHVHMGRFTVYCDAINKVISISGAVVASRPKLVALGIVGHRRIIKARPRVLALPRHVHMAGAVERHGHGAISASIDRSLVPSNPY